MLPLYYICSLSNLIKKIIPMKKLFLSILFVSFFSMAFAQLPISLGIKAGLTTSKLSTDLDDYNEKSILSYQAGLFARIKGKKFYLQPEVYFTHKGGELKTDNSIFNDNEIKLNTLDIPILLGYKIADLKVANIRVMGGPVLSFVTDKDLKYSLGGINITDGDLKDNNWALQLGIGADALMFTFDIRYEYGITDISDIEGIELKNNIVVFSLGYKFF